MICTHGYSEGWDCPTCPCLCGGDHSMAEHGPEDDVRIRGLPVPARSLVPDRDTSATNGALNPDMESKAARDHRARGELLPVAGRGQSPRSADDTRGPAKGRTGIPNERDRRLLLEFAAALVRAAEGP